MSISKLKHVVKAFITRRSSEQQLVELTPQNRKLRLMDLYILKHLETPMTDEQLTRAYNRVKSRSKSTYGAIRRRRYELAAKGLVRDTGTVVKGKYTRNMTVWQTSAQTN